MKLGLLICTYNRPNYLEQCLSSVSAATIPDGTQIVIIDDNSSKETTDLIQGFTHPAVVAKIFKAQNKSIKDSMLMGCEFLFAQGCELVMNLDGDAIVRKDFIEVLVDLKKRFRDNIVTGFNCRTKNRNGTERHKVISEGADWNKKQSVGGINMLFDKEDYDLNIRPALLESLAQGGNWDHKACIRSMMNGHEIVCAVPSVVQHIGVNSSMGHSKSEPPDVAADFYEILSTQPEGNEHVENFKKLWMENAYAGGPIKAEVLDEQLLWPRPVTYMPPAEMIGTLGCGHEYRYFTHGIMENEITCPKCGYVEKSRPEGLYGLFRQKKHLPEVTLVCIDSVDRDRAQRAIDITCEQINFGGIVAVGEVNSEKISNYHYINVAKVPGIRSKEEYSELMMKELADFVATSHILVIQHDGFVLNPSAWKDEWLQYDYIGAPWEWYKDHRKVGNGGFSLRSKRLHEILRDDPQIVPKNEPGVTHHKEEDHCICRLYRDYLESKYQIKFAPIEEARKFSIEGWGNPKPTWNGEFGFHSRRVDISKSKTSI